jgi:thiol-disulfide isomerase/thioredoxin
MKSEYILGGVVLAALVGGGFLLFRAPSTPVPEDIVATSSSVSAERTFPSPAEKALRYPQAPELVSPDGYINTPRLSSGQAGPITIGEFRGKNPVLIDIWTYSCINCQRTLPYLRSWYEKYEDKGLVIIGVHTPEFAFEKVQANVEKAVADFGLNYPVVLDNDYKTWNAFGNRFWPRKYLIDIDGYIVYDHAGEGQYEEAERAIQKVLEERAARLGSDMGAVAISKPQGVVEVDYTQLRSPEIYFGSARNERLGNGKQGVAGTQTLEIPSSIVGNTLYLGGVWNLTPEYAQSMSRGAKIVFKYGAKNVYFVARADAPTVLKVMRDGEMLGSARGTDVSVDGTVTVGADRLYHLVGDTEYGVHTLEIEIEEAGLEAYTFTFG